MLVYSTTKCLAESRDKLMAEADFEDEYEDPSIPETLQENEGEDEIHLSIATEAIEAYFNKWARYIANQWESEIKRCLGEGAYAALEQQFSAELYSEKGSVLNINNPKRSTLSLEDAGSIIESVTISIGKEEGLAFKDEDGGYFYRVVERRILAGIHEHLITCFLGESRIPYYLPAIRGGIMQSHRTLVGALIDRAAMAGLRRGSDIPLFNGVLADFMNHLLTISRGSPSTLFRYSQNELFEEDGSSEKYSNISKRIEKEILQGEIIAKPLPGTQYPDFRYFFAGCSENGLPLMSVSSSVSELAPVALFIRHLEQKDLFIVEEPEAHLHPEAQRTITKFLTQLANAGVTVLITTHSDIILEQLGNFVMAEKNEGGRRPAPGPK